MSHDNEQPVKEPTIWIVAHDDHSCGWCGVDAYDNEDAARAAVVALLTAYMSEADALECVENGDWVDHPDFDDRDSITFESTRLRSTFPNT